MKKRDLQLSNAAQRQAIVDDVAAFLKSGKTIQMIPTGQSGQDALASRRHIRLGEPKKS